MKEVQVGAQAPEQTYSKQTRNRLQQAFRSSQRQLLHEKPGYVPKDRDFMQYMPESPFPQGLVSTEAGAFNIRLPHIVDSLLNPVREEQAGRLDMGADYIAGIGGYDYQNLPGIAVHLAKQGDSARVVYRTVFGGSTETSIRSISAITPALQQMDRVESLEHTIVTPPKAPQLQVVFANNLAASLKGMNYEVVADESRVVARVMQKYVREFFPSLIDSVVFLEDVSAEESPYVRSELAFLTDAMHAFASNGMKQKLLQKGTNGSQELKTTYGAAHLLMHDSNDPRLLRPLLPEQPDAQVPEVIISMGGMQERDFYDIRFDLKPELDPTYNTIPTFQFFTRHSVPPYDMARGGDVSLASVIQNGVINTDAMPRAAKMDIEYLERVSKGRGDYDRFVAGLKSYAGGLI